MARWEDKPVYFDAIIKGKEVFSATDDVYIGQVIRTTQSKPTLFSIMTHIRIEGTNGANYFSRYSKPGSVICLKRCSEKEDARIKRKNRMYCGKSIRFGKRTHAGYTKSRTFAQGR